MIFLLFLLMEKRLQEGISIYSKLFEKFKSKEILLIKIGNNEEKFSYEINVNNIKHGTKKLKKVLFCK